MNTKQKFNYFYLKIYFVSLLGLLSLFLFFLNFSKNLESKKYISPISLFILFISFSLHFSI